MRIRILSVHGDTVLTVSRLEEARQAGQQLAGQVVVVTSPPERRGEVIDLSHISPEEWEMLAEAEAVAIRPVQGG